MDDARRELAGRPLVLAAVALVVGLTAPLHPLNVLFLGLLILARRPLPVALAFVLGLVLSPRPVAVLAGPEWVRGPAVVLDVPVEAKEGLRATVEVGGKRLRAIFPSRTPMSKGEVWNVEGKAKPLSEAGDGYRLRGVNGSLAPVEIAKLADGPWPWRVADGWRRSYEGFVRASLPPEPARWLGAFAFRLQGLEDDEIDALKSTGTIHLIAASGLHVGALGLVGMLLGTALGLPRSATLGLVFALLVLFTMATGLHLPTLRAALAFAAGSSAYLVRRDPDGLSAIALAVLAYLPFDPAAVYDLGFQLSVTVVGLLVLWPRRGAAEPARTVPALFRERVRDLLAVSLIAGLAAEPILAQRNGEITLLTLPANALAVPPVMAAVLASFVLHPLHAGWAMPLVGGLATFAGRAILLAGSVPGTVLHVPPFSPYGLTLVYLPWIAFWRPRARPCA